MTAKGGRQHRWTAEEVAYVRENAGKVPARDMRRRLKVSRQALESKRREINRAGGNITLRCFRSPLSICPSCGCRRAHMGDDGTCRVCRLRRQLADAEREVADALSSLPPDERAMYASTEATRGARRADPMPPHPPTGGMTEFERDRAEDRHDRDVELWAERALARRVKAARKRKERILKKS